MPAIDPISPEKLGEMIAQQYIKTPQFREDVEELANMICDELLHNLASKIRCKVEKQMGLKWGDDDVSEEKHYEFGMTFEGDVCMAAQEILASAIRNY